MRAFPVARRSTATLDRTAMPLGSRRWKPQTGYDWAVLAAVALVALHLGLTWLQSDPRNPVAIWSGAILGVAGCGVFIAWMLYGRGATSPLWEWLPPFYPIGVRFRAVWARWTIVILLALATAMGSVIHLRAVV